MRSLRFFYTVPLMSLVVTTGYLMGYHNERVRSLPEQEAVVLQDSCRFEVFGNPEDAGITISFKTRKSGSALISIFYADGKLFTRRQTEVFPGTNTWEYDLPVKATGVFIVRFSFNGHKYAHKIMKKPKWADKP